MDKMQWYEADICIDNLAYCDRPILELLRFNGYVTAQVNSKKKLKPSELLKFAWEEDIENENKRMYNEEAKPLSKKEAEALAEKMKKEMCG